MAKTIDQYTLPARLVAEITGAKPDTVQKQRKGWRVRGKVAMKIALVDEMYKTGHNQLIEAVKQAVNF